MALLWARSLVVKQRPFKPLTRVRFPPGLPETGFPRFERGSSVSGGSGLNLTVSRKFLKLKIFVASRFILLSEIAVGYPQKEASLIPSGPTRNRFPPL